MNLVTFKHTRHEIECWVDDCETLVAEITWDDECGDYAIWTVCENYIHHKHLIEIVDYIKTL